MKRVFKSIPEFNEILKNPSPNLKVPVYDDSKEGPKPSMGNNNRVTLNQRLDRLEAIVRDGFKQVNGRIDNLEKDINTRLDYIVKANDLKDLPKENR